MKKYFLAAAAVAMMSPALHAADGLDGNSVYSWLKSAGYVNDQSAADLAAHRKSILAKRYTGGDANKLVTDDQLTEALNRSRSSFPDFDKYPSYVQDALLDSVNRGYFGAAGSDPTVAAARAGDWTTASKTYTAMPGASAANADAFTRYARDREIEQTWERASAVGAEQFGLTNTLAASKVNQNLKSVVALDESRRQRAAGQPSFGAITPSFTFTVGSSNGGFSDISVPTNQRLQFNLRDSNIVDGDIETVTFVNSSGTQIGRTITLSSAGDNFSVKVNKGANELRVLAQNQGSLGLNTGGLHVSSPVSTGSASQIVDIHTGETAILRVTGR